MIDATIIVSFYNRIEYLLLVLAGLERQSTKNFELIIADDGSSKAIIDTIENISGNYSFNIKHLWQEDRGFRKNRILNQAIIAASSDYLIFIDGDCIPHSNFIEEHIKCSSPQVCLTGRRVNLSEKITERLNPENVKNGFLENNKLMLLGDSILGKSYDFEKGVYIKNQQLRNYMNTKKRGILGCNFSISKDDLLRINGFNEMYEAPSIGEDSDIQFRLELIGINIKSINNIAVQYHLYHPLQIRLKKNLDLFEELKKSKMSYTPFGVIE